MARQVGRYLFWSLVFVGALALVVWPRLASAHEMPACPEEVWWDGHAIMPMPGQHSHYWIDPETDMTPWCIPGRIDVPPDDSSLAFSPPPVIVPTPPRATATPSPQDLVEPPTPIPAPTPVPVEREVELILCEPRENYRLIYDTMTIWNQWAGDYYLQVTWTYRFDGCTSTFHVEDQNEQWRDYYG